MASQLLCKGSESVMQGPEYKVATEKAATVSFLKSCEQVRENASQLEKACYVYAFVRLEEDGTYTLEVFKAVE